jgi:hypothetical protein
MCPPQCTGINQYHTSASAPTDATNHSPANECFYSMICCRSRTSPMLTPHLCPRAYQMMPTCENVGTTSDACCMTSNAAGGQATQQAPESKGGIGKVLGRCGCRDQVPKGNRHCACRGEEDMCRRQAGRSPSAGEHACHGTQHAASIRSLSCLLLLPFTSRSLNGWGARCPEVAQLVDYWRWVSCDSTLFCAHQAVSKAIMV